MTRYLKVPYPKQRRATRKSWSYSSRTGKVCWRPMSVSLARHWSSSSRKPLREPESMWPSLCFLAAFPQHLSTPTELRIYCPASAIRQPQKDRLGFPWVLTSRAGSPARQTMHARTQTRVGYLLDRTFADKPAHTFSRSRQAPACRSLQAHQPAAPLPGAGAGSSQTRASHSSSFVFRGTRAVNESQHKVTQRCTIT